MASTPPRLLVADDDPDVLTALGVLLRSEGYQVQTASSPAAVLAAVAQQDFETVLVDMNYSRDTTGGTEGLDLVSRLQEFDPLLPVVVMTAWGSIEGAVEALRRGARDYVEKPWDNTRLLRVLHGQVELSRAIRKGQRLERENRALRPEGAPILIADAPAMQPVLRLMERVGPSDASTLITGEHGTGKEVVAAWLHAASPRAARPMVTVNLGGLADGVFESELFGHDRGAFTDARADRIGRFELADQGTLFLDEVANLPLTQQSKLLRVLQAGEYERVGSSRTRRADVRIIAATNVDLRAEIAAGRFREDLFFRLNTVELHLPPLRERREDIPSLAQHFLRQSAARYRRPLTGFSAEAMALLLAFRWPGNVRELMHAVERATLLAEGPLVGAADLAFRSASDPVPRLEELSLEDVERLLVVKAMSRFEGNVSRAAEALGLSRSALYRRLQRHGLSEGSSPRTNGE